MRHIVPCRGYDVFPVVTGYDKIIGQRTSSLFSTTARQDGKVVSIGEKGMVVEYADGSTQSIELGRRYGEASGQTIPHQVVGTVVVGEKFKAGDLLAYNPAFFKTSPLDPKTPVWKSGAIATVVLGESPFTLEDSSAISREFAERLSTQSTKVKQVVINFSQEVHKLAKPGTTLDAEDILCVIEDAVTAGAKLFDEENLERLKLLSSNAPKAKFAGVLERIEVFYHGDKEDMSSSVRQLVEYSDKQLAKRLADQGKKRQTGSVDEGYRVDGTPLMLDTLCINFYITADMEIVRGDKLVFANQLKSVIGKVLTTDITTVGGMKIDAFFGQKSVDNRIVNSPELMGSAAMLAEAAAKKMAALYFD